MVKSGIKYAALTLFLLALLILAGGVWLFNTTAGARALLAAVSAWTPVQIEFSALSGRFADELRLEGVRLRWPGGEAETPLLQLRWQPLQGFRGHLTIEELTLGKVEIQLQAEATPPAEQRPLQWPLVGRTPRQLTGSIAALQIAEVVIHSTAAEPLRLGKTTLRLDWQDGVLSLSQLQAQTPYGTVAGELAAGLVTPTLTAQLHGELIDHRRIQLDLNLAAGEGDELLTGPLQLELSQGKEGTLHLGGELALAASGVQLRDLLFTRNAAAGEVRGQMSYRFDGGSRPLTLQLQLADVDLAPETGVTTALAGILDLAGGPDAYDGEFDLSNRGADWQSLQLAGRLAGNRQELSLRELDGELLSGQLRGAVHLDWSGPLTLTAALQGKNLNPGILSPPLAGQINFDLSSTLHLPPDGTPQLELVARLQQSVLRGYPLTGAVDARLDDGVLRLRRLELHGDGIDLTAKGVLQEKITFAVVLRDLKELLPDAAGAGSAAGWLRWRDGELSGRIDGTGKNLAYAGITLDTATLQLQRPTPASPIALRADLGAIHFQNQRFERLELQGEGIPEQHQLRLALTWPQGQARIEGDGGYQNERWSGKILNFTGHDQELGTWRMTAPATLTAGKKALRFSALELTSARGERLKVSGVYDLLTKKGEVSAEWDDLALDRANPWLAALRLRGATSGTVEGRWSEEGTLRLHGKLVAAGRLQQGDLNLEVRQLAAELSWDERGLVADGDLTLMNGESLSAHLTSPEKGRLALPQRLTLQLDWDGLEPKLFSPWIPPALAVTGKLSGELTAELFPGQRLDLSGKAVFADGTLTWAQQKGKVTVALRQAEADWRWQGKALVVELALVLADYGRITGNVSLPVPAVLPFAMAPAGKLSGRVEGSFKEQGLLSALLPGVLQESRGDLQLDLRLGGSWQKPSLAGDLRLAGAGAYIPQAGIEVRDLSLLAKFSGEEVRILALELSSGKGKLTGEGKLQLQSWKISKFQGSLRGENFLTINLPELRLLTSPALTVSGTTEKLKIRGEIKVPELLVRGRQTQAPLHQHADVIIVDAIQEAPPEPALALDLEVRIILGDRVLVDLAGIDARLEGDVLLNARTLNAIRGRGAIRVVKGSYAAYGMKLDVTRGTLLFAGGPIDQPTLDILALRSVGEVKAGVRISGTLRAPAINLYSEPMMADTDILAYIVLGRPMGSDPGQSDLLMIAAGALLAKGESTVLQDRLRRRIGIDVLDIQAGNGDITTSMITVGKYLNPKLYVSLGHALYTGSNVVGLRYTMSKRWQVESTVGEESGVDLFYTIEFL